MPDQSKDNKYFERRKRNNVAAKKSRDARKQREDEIAIRASFLEKENAILKAQLQTLKDEAQQLRILLAQKKNIPNVNNILNTNGGGCSNCSNCSNGANTNNTNNTNNNANPNSNSINNNNNNYKNSSSTSSPSTNNTNPTNGTHNRLYNSTSFDNTDQLNVAKLAAYQHHL